MATKKTAPQPVKTAAKRGAKPAKTAPESPVAAAPVVLPRWTTEPAKSPQISPELAAPPRPTMPAGTIWKCSDPTHKKVVVRAPDCAAAAREFVAGYHTHGNLARVETVSINTTARAVAFAVYPAEGDVFELIVEAHDDRA